MIANLKDLEKVLKLCRRQGVTEITLADGVSFKLGELPMSENSSNTNLAADVNEDPYADFPQGTLTAEQLMYYSSGGLPENDPENQGGNA